MDHFDVIVIGAGPAGLLAAGRAAEKGCRVLVLEKMHKEGCKLLITGKGRCNITNDAPLAEFIKHVHPNGRFLRTAFSRFFSSDIIKIINDQGVDTVLERGGRYFPASNKSSDVLNALLRWVHKKNVEIRCSHKADRLIIEDNTIKGVTVGARKFMADHVILAMGGKSYSATGSDGDGFLLAQQAGHTIENIRPALVPLETKENITKRMKDLTLKNVKVILQINGKKADEQFGEMMFTDFGLSGPLVLTMSRVVVDALRKDQKVEMTIDLKPALDEKKLDNRLQRDLNENGKKKIGALCRSWLPSAMVPVFKDLLTIDPEKECHQVSSKERKSILYLLKNLHFTITKHRPFKEAIVTAGGVSIKEIAAGTMESKLVKGLFFAGEMIDLDAETGGYNLQIAYSTGWLAGDSCGIHKDGMQ